MKDRLIADDFRKTVDIVRDEIEFGEAADLELQPALCERMRLACSLASATCSRSSSWTAWSYSACVMMYFPNSSRSVRWSSLPAKLSPVKRSAVINAASPANTWPRVIHPRYIVAFIR